MSINPIESSYPEEFPVENYPDGQRPVVDGIDNDVYGLEVDHIGLPNCLKSADQKAAAAAQATVNDRQQRLSDIAAEAQHEYNAHLADAERRGIYPIYDENHYINQLRKGV